MTRPDTILYAILLALSLFGNQPTKSYHVSRGLRQKITRNATAVPLTDGRMMEVVEELTCSAALVRLTCRSLTSFMYILEAEYQENRTSACVWDRSSWCRYKSLFAKIRTLKIRRDFIIGRYIGEEEDDPMDFRTTLNRRCSGHHHCRYRVMSDHPEALFWRPANVRIKYACIPETSVYKYCNADIKVPGGVGGFLKSPGYPLYYLGDITCGWTFRSLPGQRIVLTFHDLSIRDHEGDGSCVDVLRVRDDGNTLLETCGSAAGVKVISNTNVVTLNLVASKRLYPARGFLVQYQVLGCPDVTAPLGSYVSNGTLQTRTFLCRAGTLFPDTGQRTRTIRCKDGQWIGRPVSRLPACVAASSAVISGRTETDVTNRLLAGLSDASGGVSSSAGGSAADSSAVLIQRAGVLRRPVGEDVFDKANNYSVMDQTKTTMVVKDNGDFVVDVILPTLLIALLFVGNAVIVYIIFQYRKRKTPGEMRGEEVMALSSSNSTRQQPNGDSRV